MLRSGQPVTVSDVAARFGELPTGGWPTPPAQALVLPLVGETGSQATGVLVLAASAGHVVDEAYKSFLSLVAQQTAALVNGAVAYQVQQRRAEELADLDRAKTTFFSNISHEFRTPLTLIMGPVEELRGKLATQDLAVREELEVIHRNGLRLGKLVNTLLDFSRIEAGRMQARYEPVDLAAFTAELASVFRSAIERAGLAYRVECRELPEPVCIDREMWEKVVFNLLSNALKFTFEGTIERLAAGRGFARGAARSATPAAGSRRPRCPGCSSVFTASPRPGPGPTRAAASGSRWCASWSGCTGAPSPPRAPKGQAPRSPSASRSATSTLAGQDLAAGGPGTISATADPFLDEALRWLPDDQPDRLRCR